MIADWAKEEMANYQLPRIFQIVPELPLNAAGKVVKDALRTLPASG
jgi:acyl-CoA synthetase (AMP-forming)/AMP-acid ligase II